MAIQLIPDEIVRMVKAAAQPGYGFGVIIEHGVYVGGFG
jgi:hypothetical protein